MNNLNIQLNKKTTLNITVEKSSNEKYSHHDVYTIQTTIDGALDLYYLTVAEYPLNLLEVVQEATYSLNKSLVIQIESDSPLVKHCEQQLKQLIAILKNKCFKAVCLNSIVAEY
mgnify:FL=1|tara:strand:- start:99 stop:440 length:342 start_codon:yes stop_codon:yes gene_type:complete